MVNSLNNLAAVANSFGYAITARRASYTDGSNDFSLRFTSLTGARFVPEIYFNEDTMEVSLQTTSYGALAGAELDAYVLSISKAYGFMKFLETFDIKAAFMMANEETVLDAPNRFKFKHCTAW